MNLEVQQLAKTVKALCDSVKALIQ